MANFRNVYKSDHLGVVDLEEMLEQGKQLVFTISHVNQEMGAKVAGSKIDANIAYFKEPIKPLVLNATNAKIVKSFARSTDTDNWNNIAVELYIDSSVKMKGEVVGGVRIKPIQPVIQKIKPIFDEAKFEKAFIANATIETITKSFQTTEETLTKYNEYVASRTEK